jgi:hypothetical protein
MPHHTGNVCNTAAASPLLNARFGGAAVRFGPVKFAGAPRFEMDEGKG